MGVVDRSSQVASSVSCSSHSSASAWGPFSRRKSSTSANPRSSQFTPEKLLLHVLLSTGCSFLQGASTCSIMGPFLICRWISAPSWTTMGCKEATCIVMSFARDFRGSSALPSLFLTLVSAELFPSHLFTPLSQFAVVQCFISLFIRVITEPLSMSLIISALDSSWS